MARRPNVPPSLTQAPFTLEEAYRHGLNRRHLVSSAWKRVAPSVYAHRALPETDEMAVEAARARLPAAAVLSGLTAAWLHGLDLKPADPVEATLPPGARASTRAGIAIRHAKLPDDEVVTVRGIRVTTVERTLLDLALRLSVTEATVAADMALHARLTALDGIRDWAAARNGRPGIARLRRVLDLAEPRSESAMETRLRVLLVKARLPRPAAQVDLQARDGRFLARADLYYPERRLVLEYDGGTHRGTLVEDNRRQNRLINAGYRLLRFTAPDILRTPAATVAQVRAALAASRS